MQIITDSPGQELTFGEVAALSDRAISAMSRDELIAVIKSVRSLLPRCSCGPEHVLMWDRATLERMVCLARRACRNVTAQQRTPTAAFMLSRG